MSLERESLNGKDHNLPVSGMYQNYFLDYASYVILERAVPMLEDGLKPVQRRLLHAMKEMDDGRYHKVANVIGQSMQYHPHGDAAIYEALVNMGQKELLIDCQGNWGDYRTGDNAAAARYIEGRLSRFALEVAFNGKITPWQMSYDGRKKEPVSLPMKFPMVLAMGVEGIAVGLSTRILPHNFCELIEASIACLQDKKVELFPDFPTGGMIDIGQYESGRRGGRIRCRAHIEVKDKNTLLIKDIPYGVTTGALMESIVKANEKGKIKIRKVTDNTAKDVEIQIDIAPDVSPDVTIDALYAFSDCEVSISPNACLILEGIPQFLSVEEILKLSTAHTKELLRKELQIKLEELKEKLLFSSLEKIFIENRIYRDIETCETWESVIETIDKGLDPFKPQFYREILREDIVQLTEIKIKRISRFDSFKADELIRSLGEEIQETEHNLAHLVDYAVRYFQNLLDKYGKGKERKTTIKRFDVIEVRQVAVANQKLYVNRKEGFVGMALKRDENVEYVCDCSDIDDVIVFRRDGKYSVHRVQDKTFVGKDLLHVDVWQKGDERKIYHAIYRDPASNKNYVKRFAVTAITRDREYDMTLGSEGSKVLYFSVHPNSEAEVVTVHLSPSCRAAIKVFEYDFAELAIKGRDAQGNILTKYPITRIVQKNIGGATLGGRKIWLDEYVGKLNTEGRGRMLGEFDGDDSILVVYQDGSYEMTGYELTNRFEMNKIVAIEKFHPDIVITAVHYDGAQQEYFVKRFKIETRTRDRRFYFISEAPNSKAAFVSIQPEPFIEYTVGVKKSQEKVSLNLAEFIDVKGWKALGNKLDRRKVSKVEAAEAPKAVELPATLKPGDQVEWKGQDIKLNQGNLFE